MKGPRILLIVGGGIAAYKSCELVRLIRKGGADVTCVLTEGGSKFVTAMALAALSENPVHTTLWDLKNEVEMGHIQLSRQADLVVVCPATANLLAKMAAGISDDLATTLMLATDKPVMAVPAMNVRMWEHAATRRNIDVLRDAGVYVMEPDEGAMACGEFGPGRLPEPLAIWHRIAWALDIDPGDVPPLPGAGTAPGTIVDFAIDEGAPILPEEAVPDEGPGGEGMGGLSASMIRRGGKLSVPLDADLGGAVASPSGLLLPTKGAARSAPSTDGRTTSPVPGTASDIARDPLAGQPDFESDPPHRPLYGRHVLITAGPTHEAIDPVRYIANRSSGKQGFAIAAAAAEAGARVTLVAGPVHLETPPGVERIDVESAREMAAAVKEALPADVAVMVAAVADWRPRDVAVAKIKKRGSAPPALLLTENPDILAGVAGDPRRPGLLVGFAAETDHVLEHAVEKRRRKGADWIIANDVSGDVMGGARNAVHVVSAEGIESLPEMPKDEVGRAIVERIAHELARR